MRYEYFIIKKRDSLSEIIFKSKSLYEVTSKMEEIAIEFICHKIGYGDVTFYKSVNALKYLRGLFAVSSRNKIEIYNKLKNTWFSTGSCEKVIEFEISRHQQNKPEIEPVFELDAFEIEFLEEQKLIFINVLQELTDKCCEPAKN